MRWTFCVAALFALQAGPSVALATELAGMVVGVTGGDRLTLQSADYQLYKIQLLGADAPEKMQAFGRKTKFSLSDLVLMRTASVQLLEQSQDGWRLGKVMVRGQDIALTQIQRGMAWWDRPNAVWQEEADRLAFEAAEATAKLQGLAVWRHRDPVPPWVYRGESADVVRKN